MSKKYFVKYIPVEEKPKAGDKILYNGKLAEQGDVSYIIKCDDRYITLDNQTQIDSIKKIKLFLCTRDIKVGDKLKECCRDNVEREIDHFETILPFGIWVFKDEQFIHANQAFKVIGEISSKAKWVKQGDEFNAGDIKVHINNRKFPMDNIIIDIEDKEDIENYYKPSLSKPDKFKIVVEVKCSTCEFFH